jgi:hypothetical protein
VESCEIWWWRRMEEISWTDHARKEVLGRVNDYKNDLHTLKDDRLTGLVTSYIEGPSKTRYWSKDRKKGSSDGKTRKKTLNI